MTTDGPHALKNPEIIDPVRIVNTTFKKYINLAKSTTTSNNSKSVITLMSALQDIGFKVDIISDHCIRMVKPTIIYPTMALIYDKLYKIHNHIQYIQDVVAYI